LRVEIISPHLGHLGKRALIAKGTSSWYQFHFQASPFANAVGSRNQLPTVTDTSRLLILQRKQPQNE
jgi:hypothetical protein